MFDVDLKKYIIFVISGVIITLTWIGLESVLDGQVIAQHSDTVFTLILDYLITDKIYNRLYK
jgi:hypothetical protein